MITTISSDPGRYGDADDRKRSVETISRSAGRSVHPSHDSVATFGKFVDLKFSESEKNISIIFQPRVTIFYKRKENHKSNLHRSFALQIFECERHR